LDAERPEIERRAEQRILEIGVVHPETEIGQTAQHVPALAGDFLNLMRIGDDATDEKRHQRDEEISREDAAGAAGEKIEPGLLTVRFIGKGHQITADDKE